MNAQPDNEKRGLCSASSEKTEPEQQPCFDFEKLAQGSSEVLIEFRGQTYRLRLTRHNKLILNK